MVVLLLQLGGRQMVLPLWDPEREWAGGGSRLLVHQITQLPAPHPPKAGCVHAQGGPTVLSVELYTP